MKKHTICFCWDIRKLSYGESFKIKKNKDYLFSTCFTDVWLDKSLKRLVMF